MKIHIAIQTFTIYVMCLCYVRSYRLLINRLFAHNKVTIKLHQSQVTAITAVLLRLLTIKSIAVIVVFCCNETKFIYTYNFLHVLMCNPAVSNIFRGLC